MSKSASPISLEGPRRWVAYLFLIASVWYLSWRAGTLNPETPLLSVLLYGAELMGFLTAALHLWTGWRLSDRQAEPALQARTVDVFVPTRDESPDQVRKTLLAALALHGPHTVWLIDDAERTAMAELAADLGCRYLARLDHEHARAGSLNHALAHTEGELIAIFDADHAPRRDFLTQTLGYFDDARIGFVQAAQAAHDGGDSASWAAPALSSAILQRGRDAWNAAILGGSCAIIRRSALAQVGGFATGTHAEDLHTSIRLHAQGWQSAFHAQPLAFSVAPESVVSVVNRNRRASRAALQVWRNESILTRAGLTLAQRLSYLSAVLSQFEGWRKGMFYVAPALVVLTGALPLVASLPDFLLHFLPCSVLGLWLADELGRGQRRGLDVEQSQLALFAASVGSRTQPALRALLSLNLGTVAAAAVMHFNGVGLPLEGAVAASVWAALNGALAWTVLRRTTPRPRPERTSHRFPVPLAAELECLDGERLQGTIDDLSESGLRFYGTLLPSMAVGQHICGELHLPDGPLAFSGEVRHMGGESGAVHRPRSIGCSIDTSHADRQRLETFLYGSDIQWQVQGDSPQAHTLLSRWLPQSVAGPQAAPLTQRRWNAAQLRRHVLAPMLPALVAAPDEQQDDDLIVSYIPLPENQPLILNVFRRITVPSRGVLLHRVTQEAGSTTGLYTYRVEATAMPVVPYTHEPMRNPALLLDDQPKWALSAKPTPARSWREDADVIDYV